MARKQKTIHYIYKTICLITNRYYIGMHSTCNLNDGYMGSGKRLRYSIRKHGVDNHVKEILEFFETRELLIEAEKEAITPEMILDVNCMNLMCGGEGGFISEEQQRYRSQCGGKAFSKKLKTDSIFREQHRIIASNNMKNALKNGKINRFNWTGRKHSEKAKNKISNTKIGTGIGENNSQYNTCWITKDGINKKIKKENLENYLLEGWIKGRNIIGL